MAGLRADTLFLNRGVAYFRTRWVWLVPYGVRSMAETWRAKLKALEDHIAAFQRSRAQTMDEAATWMRLQEALERIVPRPKGDL